VLTAALLYQLERRGAALAQGAVTAPLMVGPPTSIPMASFWSELFT